MGFLAFMSTLSILSMTKTVPTSTAVSCIKKDNIPGKVIVTCDSKNPCPPSHRCMKFYGDTGFCVLEIVDR